jgi:hypothetical protein
VDVQLYWAIKFRWGKEKGHQIWVGAKKKAIKFVEIRKQFIHPLSNKAEHPLSNKAEQTIVGT